MGAASRGEAFEAGVMSFLALADVEIKEEKALC